MPDDITRAAPDVFAAARTRRSIRAYKPDRVPPRSCARSWHSARQAPSGSNIQPWRVHVLTGATLKRVGAAIQQAFLTDEPGHKRDYDYYTDPIEEPYLARRRQCGWGLYGTLGIGRGDHAKSKAYRAGNYNFFGAPAGLIFTIDRDLEHGSWLDYGMFLQTIMLAARATRTAHLRRGRDRELPGHRAARAEHHARLDRDLRHGDGLRGSRRGRQYVPAAAHRGRGLRSVS